MKSPFDVNNATTAQGIYLDALGSAAPRIRDYELLKAVGSGAYGEVWLARSVAGSFRAVKIVSRPIPDDRCFEREFAGVQRFEPVVHSGWVRILHVGRDDQARFFYYVMEAADDCTRKRDIVPAGYSPRTLSSELAARGRFPWEEVVRLGISLADALDALHRQNLIHRDIKPSNVIYLNGEPKLADIGLVMRIGEPETSRPGTEGYFDDAGYGTASSDIYSLGKLLYVAWTDMDARDFPVLPEKLDNGGETKGLKRLNQLLLTACERDPKRRFKSVGVMREALEDLLEKDTVQGTSRHPREIPTGEPRSRYITILGHATGSANRQVALLLKEELKKNGWPAILDEQTSVNIVWARQLQSKAAEAEAVVVLLSSDSVQSEMMAYELELAREASCKSGKPTLIPVRVQYSEALPPTISRFLPGTRSLHWENPADGQQLIEKIFEALKSPAEWQVSESPKRFEPPWGAMPPDSTFYVVRPTDHDFRTAIAQGDSIVLIRGARQMGKTSLLARGLREARAREDLVVLTDFQDLSSSDFESVNHFYQALANSLALQLDLEVSAADVWDSRRSANANFDRFLRREVFDKFDGRIVWGLDEVDRLFICPFGTEVFGMFRSWHNKRALDPHGPWADLTLVIVYATEAHLFITDLNQSPFNVGTALSLEDFDRNQVADLNSRYGCPLQDERQLTAFYHLVNGHPFLVRRGLHELATRKIAFDQLQVQATRDQGIFGDHLRRILASLCKDEMLVKVVRTALDHAGPIDPDSFYRLRAAGVMTGETVLEARLRCQLYADFLRRHLQ
jgi:serine/threonine protein kinase